MDFIVENRYQDLITVDSTKGEAIYELRVLRKWKCVDLSKPSFVGCVDLVLIDIHGIKIHATIPKDLVPTFDERVIEGGVYLISSVDVRFNFGTHLPSYHRYKFVFTQNTIVDPATNSFIPDQGFELIEANDVKKKGSSFRYLVDVIGLITSAIYDKNFFHDGTISQSVTFTLHDGRKSFLCEFSGKLVDEFTNCLKPHVDGLPILVLQFVKIGRSQGSVLVEGVHGVTRMFADPIDSVAVWNFKKSLVKFLSANFDYSGLYRPTTRVPVSYTMEFLKDHPIRTMAELKSNPELGYFIVNARLSDIVSFDPWWYAMCDCPRVFRGYIGDFQCTMCKDDKWSPSPKVKLTFEVDDDTGSGLFRAFDNVMVSVAAVKSSSKGIDADTFYKVLMGFSNNSEELPVVTSTGYVSTTTDELINQYLSGINPGDPFAVDVASSSGSKRARDD
ncbi:replication factor A protein [Trifolium repens]|nr:replication factor A protein [Trifolium repens]